MSDAQHSYFGIGRMLAIPAFFWSWWYCADQYGLLLGLGLGWLPAGIIAAAVTALWPVALLVFVFALISPSRETDSTFWKMAEGIAIWELLWMAAIAVIVTVMIVAELGRHFNEKQGWQRTAFISAFPLTVVVFFAATNFLP